eukprot:TRINITY_DN3565_c0_g1_i1.p1 TRINITY_DN3565_c0_g1~~TRINITY_DN3565_c0_g1_i1.p1  ORF type:complete len:166 (-),score=49.45 TRINITY_DN3565_c0_g1_i1:154-624(-)
MGDDISSDSEGDQVAQRGLPRSPFLRQKLNQSLTAVSPVTRISSTQSAGFVSAPLSPGNASPPFGSQAVPVSPVSTRVSAGPSPAPRTTVLPHTLMLDDSDHAPPAPNPNRARSHIASPYQISDDSDSEADEKQLALEKMEQRRLRRELRNKRAAS